MKVEVQSGDWGDASIDDIEIVLINAAEHINRLVNEPVADHIIVVRASADKNYPQTRLRDPRGEGPITIQLAPHGRDWARFTYEFAHEFCHVLSNYEQLWGNGNMWFHEALCELSSIFTLRRMAEAWQHSPPYQDQEWRDYASCLAEYASSHLAKSSRRLPQDETLAQWLHHREIELRESIDHSTGNVADGARDQYAVAAYQLLPIFEGNPRAWNAVRNLPTSDANLNEYLLDWCHKVASEDRALVGCIMELFSDFPEDCPAQWGTVTGQ